MQLLDILGQESFRIIAKNNYKSTHGIILIYDLTNRKTYENITKRLNQIMEKISNKISILLFANII